MSRGLMIALVSAVLVLALGVTGIGVYVFIFLPGSKGEATEAQAAAAKVEVKAGTSLALKKFVTNLADTDRVRYIDLTIALGLKAEADKTEAEKMEPEIRNVILSQIRGMTSQELLGSQGQTKLAEGIKKGLEEILKDKLVKVYVTDMVIQ